MVEMLESLSYFFQSQQLLINSVYRCFYLSFFSSEKPQGCCVCVCVLGLEGYANDLFFPRLRLYK